MKAVLVFVDGIICDYRQRQHLSGTPDFYKREVMMKDAPTPDSVRCLQELAQRYKSGLSDGAARDGQGGHRRMAQRDELSEGAALRRAERQPIGWRWPRRCARSSSLKRVSARTGKTTPCTSNSAARASS